MKSAFRSRLNLESLDELIVPAATSLLPDGITVSPAQVAPQPSTPYGLPGGITVPPTTSVAPQPNSATTGRTTLDYQPGVDDQGVQADPTLLNHVNPGDPQPTLQDQLIGDKTTRQRFIDEIKKLHSTFEAPSSWQAHHFYPQILGRAWNVTEEFLHSAGNLVLIPQYLHDELNGHYDAFEREQAKKLGVDMSKRDWRVTLYKKIDNDTVQTFVHEIRLITQQAGGISIDCWRDRGGVEEDWRFSGTRSHACQHSRFRCEAR